MTMTRSEFVDYTNNLNRLLYSDDEWEPTNITCPECGNTLFVNTRVVLTSNPPKRQYKCKNCRWNGAI